MAIGPVEAYIRDAAVRHGIDPDIAVRVARSEGGLDNPFRHGAGPAPHSQDPKYGSTENSYGPFQLYVSGTGAGLGDRALAAGIDPTKDWQRGIDFALNEVRNKGWGQWYGARGQGITGMMGVGGHAASVASPQAATDAAGPAQQPSTGTPLPAPGTPGGAMGPPNPPGWNGPPPPAPTDTAVAARDATTGLDKNGWRNTLAHLATGFKMPAIARNDTTLAGMAMPAAARIDTPEMPTFDPNQINQQRQNLAMAMQRLNSGRLF
jgi:hypothetical protein